MCPYVWQHGKPTNSPEFYAKVGYGHNNTITSVGTILLLLQNYIILIYKIISIHIYIYICMYHKQAEFHMKSTVKNEHKY